MSIETVTRKWPDNYAPAFDRDVMTNFDHSINIEMADTLKSGPHLGSYSAWNFHAVIWWDCEISKWCSEASQYHVPVEVVAADELQEIMDYFSDKYGDA